jgi:hypothetical protein
MQIFLKDSYSGADASKVFHVSLLKIICVDPSRPRPGIILFPSNSHTTNIYYNSDYLHTSYKVTEEYKHEISEDLKITALKDNGILLQILWDVYINDCGLDIGTTAERLADSVSWEINVGGDLFTKILSAKFSSHFFTKCAILSDVVTNHSDDESLAEFIENNDIGLPLAQRVASVEKTSDLDEEEIDDFDYIEDTWEQLCETLGVDKYGDYTSLADMRSIKSNDGEKK